jgi:SnoaL-like domain
MDETVLGNQHESRSKNVATRYRTTEATIDGPRTDQNDQWTHLTRHLPEVIARYLNIARSANAVDADRIVACCTADGQVTDVDETIRGSAAIRNWWVESATRFRYSMEVLEGQTLAPDRYVVFVRLVGNFPGGVTNFAETFLVRDGLIAELNIALTAIGGSADETPAAI